MSFSVIIPVSRKFYITLAIALRVKKIRTEFGVSPFVRSIDLARTSFFLYCQ